MHLLIVDDEDYTREGLIQTIPWEKYGVRKVTEARDGEEALSRALEYKPDIVLTDIKMPRLNGIEFAKKLAKQCPGSILLFMSGYLEIDYLKSAIELSAIDYIEKPINPRIVENAIKKAVESIDKKRKQDLNATLKKELQMQKLANMLRYTNKDIETIEKTCEEIEYPKDSYYMPLIILNKEKTISQEENINKINNFWEQNNVKSICAYIEGQRYFVVIELEEKREESLLFQCKKLLQQEKNYYIGLGYKTNNLLCISQSYDTALFNINRSFYNIDKRIYLSSPRIKLVKNIDSNIYIDFNHVLQNTPQDLANWMEEVFEKLYKTECYRKEHIQNMFSTFAKEILQNEKGLFTQMNDMYNVDDVEEYIMSSLSLFQIEEFMVHLVKEYDIRLEEQLKYSKLIRDVISYIDTHYHDVDLTVEDIAEYMHYSSPYLSVLFKQEMGVTMMQYISNYRLEASKKLLENEHYKIKDIAELVGYSNANYFAKVFKNATNKSPIEYRKESL